MSMSEWAERTNQKIRELETQVAKLTHQRDGLDEVWAREADELRAELAQAREELSAAWKKEESLYKSLENLTAENARLKTLNAQLEIDLAFAKGRAEQLETVIKSDRGFAQHNGGDGAKNEK